jgi:sugar phosphate isomerase/epimerase
MPKSPVSFAVFTKPWKVTLPELGSFVRGMGFDGIELPVRPGYQVAPDAVATGLPEAVRILGEEGMKIFSIAGPADERTIEACGEAGIPVIRIMIVLEQQDILAQYAATQRAWDRLVPALDRCQVTIGVQNHCDNFVANAMGLHYLLEKYDPKHLAAVWDAAHNALEGELPEIAIDILWPRLCMVNLKNALRRRAGAGASGEALWEISWCAGQDGFASWPRVATELKRREYKGTVCLTAEYDDEERVVEIAQADLAFAKRLFE